MPLLSCPNCKTKVSYCHHGIRSQLAAEFLLRQGFEHVQNLVGGIDAWSVDVDASIPRY